MGIFGNMFDFNRDGKMDTLEQASEFSFFMHMMESEKEGKKDEDEVDDLELDEIMDD